MVVIIAFTEHYLVPISRGFEFMFNGNLIYTQLLAQKVSMWFI